MPNPVREQSLRSLTYHLSMSLQLVEREDLLACSYEGYRARQAVAGALVSACKILGADWQEIYPDGAAFRTAFRAVMLFYAEARAETLSPIMIHEITEHLEALMSGAQMALEEACLAP